MLIDFFYTLRSAKLPVSVKEYLVLLEALQQGVVGPESDGNYSLDDFYYLSRTALVKDEKHYDKFDRAFAAYFKGVELLADFTKDIPLEWLRKNLELELSPEEKARRERLRIVASGFVTLGGPPCLVLLRKILDVPKPAMKRPGPAASCTSRASMATCTGWRV